MKGVVAAGHPLTAEAGAQHLRTGVSREWMACGDDARHGRAASSGRGGRPGRGPQNLGMNSGTSTSIRDDCSELRVTRGSPRGSEKRDVPGASTSRRGGRRSP